MTQDNRTTIARRVAGLSALAVLVVACSGSSDGAGADDSVPGSDLPVASVAEVPDTVAPPVTDPPVEEPAIDPADIPDTPCEAYVDESGYPLKPCDSGPLVETLQRDLESLFPDIAIDGLYGGQTFGFIEEIQTAAGDEVTGLVSEDLADQVAAAESIDDLGAAADAPTDTVVESDAADIENGDVGEVTEELCNELIGDAANPNFNTDTIEGCSALGIDLVGEG